MFNENYLITIFQYKSDKFQNDMINARRNRPLGQDDNFVSNGMLFIKCGL